MKAGHLRLLPVVAVLALLALLSFPGGASADPLPGTIVVGSRVDADQGLCSLRDAIATANTHTAQGGCAAGLASGTDTIEIPAETYDLGNSGQLAISSDMNIVGAGAHSIVIHASTGRVFEITNSANVAISGVTIEAGNASAGGGILIDSGSSLTLQDSIVTGNLAATSGGGIENDGSLTITGSTIENNSTIGAPGTGGGINDLGASLSITNSTIMSNTSQGDGGGVFVRSGATLTNDTIANNQGGLSMSGSGGGGIAVSGSTASLTNTLLAGNTWNGDHNNCSSTGIVSLGGNLDDDGTCGLGVGDQSNVASAGLGPVDQTGPTDVLTLDAGSPAIDNSNDLACPAIDQRDVPRPQGSDCDIGAYEFTPNAPTDYDVSTVAELSSAVSSAEDLEAPATIHLATGHYDIGTLIGAVGTGAGLEFDGAGAAGTILDGDGASRVFDIGGSVLTTIKGVTVENSQTGIEDNGNLELDDSVVQANTGLGIDSTNAGLTVSGSTISGNGVPSGPAQSNGGIFSEAPLQVVNSTISGNDGSGVYVDSGSSAQLQNVTVAANPGIGLLLHATATATAVNTIVASNGGGDCSVTGSLTAENNNLDTDSSCQFSDPSDVHADPGLGTLKDNGGPTPTMALASDSSAIDTGDGTHCPATDQRGVSRPQGAGCDIGAYEFVPLPLTGSIAFESDRNGSSEIFAMGPDGSNVVQLTHDPVGVTDSLPSISPDGHTIVYQRTSGGATQIWAIDGDGSNPRQLTSLGTNNQQPTFSPDGTKIAFDSDRNGTSQLFVMNADGSGQTQVMTVAGSVGGSSWSLDGSQIAFNDDSTGTNQIYTVDVGTRTVTGPLTGPALTNGASTNPHWSPDGSKILFVSTACTLTAPFCGGGESVYLMNADGTNQKNLTAAPIFDADPAWSPDGSRIAFVRDLGGENFNVFTANANGTNQVQLTHGTAPQRNSFPNWGTQVSAAGLVSGSVDQSIVQPVDLTAAGSSDWALWGYNSTPADQPASALTPNETKANGGRQISDLSIVNGDGTGTRGFGSFTGGSVPFSFSWTDGAPDAAVSGGSAGLTAPKVGQGLSFTVPADKTPRTLTIWTSAHYADGTLTAHLSDGSAPDFEQTIHAVQGDFQNAGENAPAIFTLKYHAASAGQHLTVTWTQSANNNCPGGCEDVVLYAAALSGPLSNLKVSATPSSAGAGINQVPIASIPNAWLSFYAGTTSSTPVGSTPVGSTPVGSTPVGSTPVGSTPVGSTPVGSTPVGSTAVGLTPVGSTGVLDLPVGSTPVGSTALGSLLLSQIPLCGDTPLGVPGKSQAQCVSDGATWAQVIAGTSFANLPLNSLTLANVVGDPTAKARLAALPLKDVSFATSLFQSVRWSSLLLGGTPIDSLHPPDGYDSWCGGATPAIAAFGGSCTNVTSATSVLQMDVGGQLGSAPVGSTPVGSTSAPVDSTPVGSTPVGSTDVPSSRLANIKLADIAGDDGDLSSVVDCSEIDCTSSTLTLGDAYAVRAIRFGATFTNIQHAMFADGITYDDVLIAILGAAGLPWEQLPLQGLQPYSQTPSTVHYTVSTDVDCSAVSQFTITARLPDGFFPVNDSADVSVGNNAPASAGAPNVTQKTNAYQWTANCPPGDNSVETAKLTFDSWVGLRLGTFMAGATAAANSFSTSTSGAPVTVHQNSEAQDPSSATEIQPDKLVAGHIAFGGEQAFYKVNLTGLAPGTRISAFLNVPSDADLDLTMSAPATPEPTSSPVGSTPVGSTPIEDQNVGFSTDGEALSPDTLQDVPVGSTPVGSTPVGSTPVGSTSDNRGSGVNESGAIITEGQSGYVTVGVSGYNGAASDQPFVLRVQETPPPPLPTCPARSISVSASAQGTLPATVNANTKTLFILDKQRLTALYGSAAVTTLLSSLTTLAARSEVSGAVLPVDGNAAVRSAYTAWDAGPCSTSARNAVVKSINDVVAGYRANNALPNLHYIVLIGSDEATPMADAPDPVLLSPEEDEASGLSFTTNGGTQGNALYASAAQNQILTDGAYGAFTNIQWLGRSLLLPQLSVSRLVESPGDVVGQITRYLKGNGYTGTPQSAVGTLNPTSATVTGYDFLADGSQSVSTNLAHQFSGLTSPANFANGDPSIFNPPTTWKALTPYKTGDVVRAISTSSFFFQAQNAGTSSMTEPVWPTILGGTVTAGGITWKAIQPWSASDTISGVLASANPASIDALDGHYNQYELEAADGSLATTAQATSANLAARILFTMGCHGGLNVADTLLGGNPSNPTGKYLDWPELYAKGQAAVYIGNTGFGYGDTASVALSERLLALYARNLHSNTDSVGEQWAETLGQYFATAGSYDVYDEKVMEETTFYGLPFWHFGTAPVTPLSGSLSSVTAATPLTRASGKNPTTASASSLSTSVDPVTGTQSATVSFPAAGDTTQSQFGLYRPILPITSQEVTSNTGPATGLWIKSLSSVDTPNVTPKLGYPTIDLSAHEPPPDFQPIFFPSSPFTLEHSFVFGNERDYLNVSDQFRPNNPADGKGTQRHFALGTFEVFYGNTSDRISPLISDVNVTFASGTANIAVRATDASSSVAEVAVLVNDGSWHYVPLSQSSDPTLWTGSISGLHEDPEVFAEATDGTNVSYSANKGSNFTSVPADAPAPALITLTAPFGTYFTGSAVNATFTCSGGFPTVAQCNATLDGNSIQSGAPINTATPGQHTFVVTALDADGNVVATLQRTYTVAALTCQTGSLSGSLTVKSGVAYCIQGGKVSGSITVQSGGSLYMSGGSVSGSISSTGAGALTLCGTSVSGSINVSSSSGLVQLGGPSGSGCAANKLSGLLSLTGNTDGVIVSGNKISAGVLATNNGGGVTFTNNTVSGSVSITNNTGGFAFSGNTISGSLTLHNNT